MTDAVATIVGNLTRDPELRFTAGGYAVVNFDLAVNRGHKDRDTGEWVEDDVLFMRCTAWGDLASNIADSMRRGQRVTATGDLEPNSWEDKDTGKRRTVIELRAREVAASLRFATVNAVKTTREKAPDTVPDPWTAAEPATAGAPF